MPTSLCVQTNQNELISDIQSLFSDECYISILSETIDDAGGRSKIFTEGSMVLGSLNQFSNREGVFVEKLSNVIGWTIKIPYETVVDATSRVRIGTTTYEVLGIKYNPSTPFYKMIICMEII